MYNIVVYTKTGHHRPCGRSGVQLSAGAEMGANGDQAAAASNSSLGRSKAENQTMFNIEWYKLQGQTEVTF